MKNNKKKVFIAWCIIPALVLFCLFMVYPIIKGFSMSLYSWGGLSDNATFIGFDNFKTLFTDEYFIKSLKNTGFLLLVFPSITIVFSLLLAIFLTQGKLKEKNFYRLVFFFPNVLSMVVIGVLFTYIYDPSIGILNSFFEMLGLESLQLVWLGDPKTVLWALAMAMVWQAVGYYMVIYMAGLDGIPPELYEVADIEGATFWQRFRYVTLPMIWEIVRVTLVFFITGVFNLSFIFVNVMTGGGPDGGSEVLLTYMYKQAFVNSNYGYAMAIGVVIFIMAVGLALILNRITKKSEA
ncbi:sugar ABC transporter permease [Clostridium sardiniense]|uniref:Sugar ABC transporter permease n=1 Tax=Clostridium sardiniense TaxID=29369 RepID=A0ABS7KZ77_CLOSR|nr:sugar ABC transporter permease [Clostridium sardiniense]MBM7833683.1 N-acetylglucosamine transport system permease protein [Clostridium sardiniense]MBY0756114.1 sugar ABC transporter permease [Clostridium sardiniense]MDQ0458943.1 N-acetylglucosamine transport system permease protein [Clostridium sardiniense]